MKKCVQLILSALGIALLGGASLASTEVTYNGFSDTTGLTLNGSAAVVGTSDGSVLRVCPAKGSSAGSVFSAMTVNASKFSTFFKFRLTDSGGTLFDGNDKVGADGLVFVVQSVSSSIGGSGQGIGYDGIGSSVGAEIDTWHNSANNDPDSNHIGIDVNGSVNHGSGSLWTQSVSPEFNDGNLWYAWVDYDGTDMEFRVNQTGVRSATADLTRSLDIKSILGQDTAYVGFTSGTGADWNNHDVLYWTYRDYYNPITPGSAVPEPSSIALLAMGIGSILAIKRKIK